MSYKFTLVDASRGGARGQLVGVIYQTTLTQSYVGNGVQVTVGADLMKELKQVMVQEITKGYVAVPASISGRAFKVKLYYVPDPAMISGSNSALTEVASGTDVSGATLVVFAVGYQ